MSRRDLGTSIRRRGKTVDKPAMEQMLRRERAMRKRRRKQKSISLAAAVSKNVIALATSLHGIGPLIQDGTLRKRVADMEPAWHPPRGFSLVPIEMSNFSMELLLHQIGDNAGDSEQVDTAERLLMENREVVYSFMVVDILERFEMLIGTLQYYMRKCLERGQFFLWIIALHRKIHIRPH